MIEKYSFPLRSGELVKLIPGQYIRLNQLSEKTGPFVVLESETNAMLVDYQGETDAKSCWTVLASDEILVAWEDNLSRV